MNKVQLIRDKLRTSRIHQNSYADVRIMDFEFEIDDYGFPLSVRHERGDGNKGKLSFVYVGPYTILKRIGNGVYELEFPTLLVEVYPILHISLLKKCVGGNYQ